MGHGPERETLELAAAGAAEVLGSDHRATQALAKAAITMDKADLWRARLAVKTLRRGQREAIAEVGESRHGRHHLSGVVWMSALALITSAYPPTADIPVPRLDFRL